MTDDEPYTNLDLDTAEEMLIGAGRPELAKALRYQAQGVRNLVQGEWGRSFVGALENIMDTRVISVLTSVQQRLDEQIGLVQQLITMVRDANATAHEALSVSKAGAARLGKLEKDVRLLGKRTDDSDADRAQLNKRLANIEQLLEARPAAREKEHQAIADEVIRQLDARDENGKG